MRVAEVLSVVFRTKYLAGLQRACTEGQLTFAAGTTPLADAARCAALVSQLRATPWVVYAKRPCGGPAQVLQSLGRDTHRIAISNARLVSLVDGVVQFRWKDYADRGHTKIMALDVDEFLRRFLRHVLPRGFVRIRHVGLRANRQRRAAIRRARHLLGAPTPAAADHAPSAESDHTLCATAVTGLGRSWRSSARSDLRAPGRSRPVHPTRPDTTMTITTHLASPAARLNQARVVVCLDGRRPAPAQATDPRVSVHAANVVPADPALTRPTSHTKPHAAASSTIQSP